MKSTKLYATLLAMLMIVHAFGQKELPAAVSTNWLETTKTSIRQMEYSFYPAGSPQHFRAANTNNHIRFTVQPNGYEVANFSQKKGEEQWQVNFGIGIVGRKSSNARSADHFTVVNSASSLTYQSASLDVEYINDTRGMRQNFIVKEKPAGTANLCVNIPVTSSLETVLQSDNKLVFHTPGNPKDIQLIYDELKVWDAANTILPAGMKLDPQTNLVSIIVDDRNAVYPITVDPLNRTPEWTTSAEGILPGLLNNLQLQVESLYGFAVAGLGDVNGDGFDDIAVSAPSMADVITGTGTLTGVGAVFIYFGSPSGLPATPTKVLQPTTAVTGALFGYSVTGGDVTGDGLNDILIGAPLDRVSVDFGGSTGILQGTVGKVYIYEGGALSGTNPTPLLSVSLTSPLLTSATITLNPLFGFSLAVANDMNGDGKGDIVVGAPTYTRVTGVTAVKTGGAFVFLSNAGNTFSTVRSLEPPTGALLGLLDEVEAILVPIVGNFIWNTVLEPLLSPILNGQVEGLLFGYSVDGAGDYNNDTHRGDVIVGAPAGVNLGGINVLLSGQLLGGSAYIFGANGTATGINTTLSARLQAQPTGLLSNAANLFGYEVKGVEAVFSGRNGNVLVGAPAGAVLSNIIGGLQVKAGQVHVFKKKTGVFSNPVSSDQVIASPRSSSILSILAGQTINLSVLYGASIDNMLDVNCDGIGDIIVGEPLSSAVPLIGADVVGGAAYIYLGQSNGLYIATPFWDLTTTVSPLLGVNATSLIGFSVAGARYIKGRPQGARALVGGPSNSLDFGIGLLNLGNTLGTTFDFVFDDNGLGKAYTFPFTSCNIVLPATIIEFEGKAVEKTVALNWTSVTEENLDMYELQRSTDGVRFETIAIAFAKGTQVNNYEYIDRLPYKGVNYYRLKIIDKDKQFSYSNIVAIRFDQQLAGDMVVAPNPVQNDINIRIEGMEKGTYRAELISTSGQVILTRSITVSQFVQTETIQRNQTMASGIYWLNIYDNTSRKVKSLRVVLTKQ